MFRLIVVLGLFLGVSCQAFAQDTSLPLSGVWNGFLAHENVAECTNLGSSSASLRLTARDYLGAELGTADFTLAAQETTHLSLNQFPITNSYGLFEITATDGGTSHRLSCVSSVYRMAAFGAAKTVEYAYALPSVSALSGTSAGIYNSINPSISSTPVYNYLTIYNPGSSAFSGDVNIYAQDGSLSSGRSFRVSNLAAGGRLDFAVGHEEGQVVGLFEIDPDDNSQEYGAFLTRYALNDAGVYTFAFPVLAVSSSCSPGPVPASTMDPATNWGEVANPTANEVDVRIQILDRNGTTLLDETRTIAPYSQHHTYINQYLGSRNVGTFSAECVDGGANDKILVQSLYYGHTTEGSAAVEWAYASQARGQTFDNDSAVIMPLNTNLSMSNWGKVFDVSGLTSAATDVTLTLYNSSGTDISSSAYAVPENGSIDVALHDVAGTNFVGFASFIASSSSSLRPELLRVFPHESTSIGYIMPIPTTISLPVETSGERTAALADYQTNYLGSAVSSSELGWSGDVATCSAGTLPDAVHTKVLQRINYFRRIAGLQDNITFDTTKNAKAQQAALIMSANSSLSHFPPTSWDCYTSDGASAAGASNLALGTHSTSAISLYVYDPGAGNYHVGHRRWVLYSRAKVMGQGSTSNAHALWVIGDFETPSSLPEFIAWPPEGYVPSPLVYPRWSFAVPGASFSDATVSMTDSNGNPISLTVNTLATGFGDPTIVWEPTSIPDASASDVTVTVNVNNVTIGGESQDFSYDVIIFSP